jgi:hypothetical protein
MAEIHSFPKSHWGIPEPPASCGIPRDDYRAIDLVVVPGVAFDCQCQRLGHGKGYYGAYASIQYKNTHKNNALHLVDYFLTQVLERYSEEPKPDRPPIFVVSVLKHPIHPPHHMYEPIINTTIRELGSTSKLLKKFP